MNSTSEKPVRVLLIAPPGNYIPGRESKHCVQPLGVAYIAAVLEKAGFPTSILDAMAEGYEEEMPANGGMVRYGLRDGEIRERIKGLSPHIVGVTCPQSTKHHEACRVLRTAKEVDPSILTLIGGAHATAVCEELASREEVDLVAVGEGEWTTLEICRRFGRGETDFSMVPGVAFKSHTGRIHVTGKARVCDDLDSLPYPAYHLLPMERYWEAGMTPGSFVDRRKFTIMITSRGCPNHCDYCPTRTTFGPCYRKRSTDDVLGEILYLREQFGIEEVLFEDSNILCDRERVVELCREMRDRVPGLAWSCPHGLEVSRLDARLIREMAEAGCDTVYLAVETMNKGITRFQPAKEIRDDHLREMITVSRSLGMRVVCFFMLGFPGEEEADLDGTVAYAKTLDLDYVCFFCATPLPGTELFRMCAGKENLCPDFDYSRLRYSRGNIETDAFTVSDVESRRRSGWEEIMKDKKKKPTTKRQDGTL